MPAARMAATSSRRSPAVMAEGGRAVITVAGSWSGEALRIGASTDQIHRHPAKCFTASRHHILSGFFQDSPAIGAPTKSLRKITKRPPGAFPSATKARHTIAGTERRFQS